MSESLTVETGGGNTVTRRPRTERPEREAAVIEQAGDQISPEDALRDSQSQLQAKDREVADARRAAREADQRRVAAETAASQANQARFTDRAAVVAGAIESATSEQQSAEMAMRAARESGDIEAEIRANKALSSATYRLSQSTAELEYLKANPQPQPQRQQSGGEPVDERSQRWLAEHPRYYADAGYRATAMGAHADAVRANQQPGSEGYIQHIDKILNQVYGDGHDTTGSQANGGQQHVRDNGGARPAPRGDALPPSRGNSQSNGWRTVNTLLGPVSYQDRADGTRGIRFLDKNTQENMREGSQTSKAFGFERDEQKALADYTNDQIEIALERASGGTGGLVSGDGAKFE